MVLGVFGSQHGTQRKAAARVGIVADGDDVGIAVVADGMDAGHLAATDMVHAQQFGVGGILGPGLLAVQTLHNLLGQRDGRATGMIQFMNVVGLLHLHIVLGELVHDFGQIAVDG